MIKLLVISACFCVAYASLSFGPFQPKPEKFKNQEGCYIPVLDEVIPHGQQKSAKSPCMKYICAWDSVMYVSCDAARTKPPCKLVEDKEKPFPGCCPKVWCP